MNRKNLLSADYVENYLNSVENLPRDVQQCISRLRELDYAYSQYIQNLKTVVDSLIIDDDHDENDTSGEDMLGPTKNKYTEARESAEQLVKSMHIEDIDAERLAISNKIKVFVQERGNMLDMTKEMLDEFMNNDDNQDTGSESEDEDCIVEWDGNVENENGSKGPGHCLELNDSTQDQHFTDSSFDDSINGSKNSIPNLPSTSASDNKSSELKKLTVSGTDRNLRNSTKNSNVNYTAIAIVGPLGTHVTHNTSSQRGFTSTKSSSVAMPTSSNNKTCQTIKNKEIMKHKGKTTTKQNKPEAKQSSKKSTSTSDSEGDDSSVEVYETDPDEPKYCVCEKTSRGDMILCDNTMCPIEWFHFDCVKINRKPKGKWFCPRCRRDENASVMKDRSVLLKELDEYNSMKEQENAEDL
ncbi:inhibitor of growth protein 1 isoform X2 [Folsomia candida]|uniref:inhibitor of growth protein 1 isoform X2 n=1 Tax=Folsomia candida TaxID=158441 RepID=UPI000B8F76AE|nr:inhibitor of growth protein 1 isoform X2 [Folsomia candida]